MLELEELIEAINAAGIAADERLLALSESVVDGSYRDSAVFDPELGIYTEFEADTEVASVATALSNPRNWPAVKGWSEFCATWETK